MIGIVDRPIVHYVVDEILSAGTRHIVFVISPGHHQFKKYLEYLRAKDPEWQKLGVKFDFVVQKKPLGNGDAVWLARKFVGKNPFILSFGDDILTGKNAGALRKMVDLFEKTKAPIVALEKVPRKEVFRYGVVRAVKSNLTNGFYEIKDVVEKPKVEAAPSNLAIIGRYVLTAEILDRISKLYPYKGKEIGVADALKSRAQDGEKIYGWIFDGIRFDGGSKLGILKAQAYFGMHHPELGKEFRTYLGSLKARF